jgi:hypothetical protein
VTVSLDGLRRALASLPPAPPALEPLLAKTCDRAYTITDADIESARAAGASEDEIFEGLVQVALAEGLRRLDRADEVIG